MAEPLKPHDAPDKVCFACDSKGVNHKNGCPTCGLVGTCRIEFATGKFADDLRKCPALPDMPMFNKKTGHKRDCPFCGKHQHVMFAYRVWLSRTDFVETTRKLNRQEARACLKKNKRVEQHDVDQAVG